MADGGRARACAADECERPCFHDPGNPWNSRGVARAARSPRSRADSTRDDLHAPRNIFALPRPDDSGAARANQPELDPGSEQALHQQEVLAGLAQFHYLGFMRMEEGWRKKGEMAVLTKNDDLHVVRTGETVEDHVVVKAITQESVTLQDRRSRVEHTVLLSEEAPLQPSRMLKKPTSSVLASLRGSTYRSVRLSSSLAAALLDGLFEHPAQCSPVVLDVRTSEDLACPHSFSKAC